MHRLLRFLFSAEVALQRYCLYLALLAIIPSACFYSLARWVAAVSGMDVALNSAPALAVTPGSFFGSVVFAPVAETLLLAGLLKVLSFTPLHPAVCAAAAAVFWGWIHGLSGALWFFGTAWSFFVFSCGYIAWRHASFGQGFLAASVPHALVNSIAMLLLWVAQGAVQPQEAGGEFRGSKYGTYLLCPEALKT